MSLLQKTHHSTYCQVLILHQMMQLSNQGQGLKLLQREEYRQEQVEQRPCKEIYQGEVSQLKVMGAPLIVGSLHHRLHLV